MKVAFVLGSGSLYSNAVCGGFCSHVQEGLACGAALLRLASGEALKDCRCADIKAQSLSLAAGISKG